jgi:hypothetical protein
VARRAEEASRGAPAFADLEADDLHPARDAREKRGDLLGSIDLTIGDEHDVNLAFDLASSGVELGLDPMPIDCRCGRCQKTRPPCVDPLEEVRATMLMTLRERLCRVEVDLPVAAGGALQVFGLRWEIERSTPYLVMDEAIAAKTLEISETSVSGTVPLLKVKNSSDARVLLLAGEQLVGAKQNRVLNASIMVPGLTELPIHVSCVERGRWHSVSKTFASSGTTSHGKLRSKIAKQASESYQLTGAPQSKQSEVWREIDQKLESLGTISHSSALAQAYEDRARELDAQAKAVRLRDGATGVAFAIGGKITGVDLFDRPSTLDKLLPKLVKAHALDALGERPAPIPARAVAAWLAEAIDASFEEFDSTGLGKDVRIRSKAHVGACLVVDGAPIHFELFPEG